MNTTLTPSPPAERRVVRRGERPAHKGQSIVQLCPFGVAEEIGPSAYRWSIDLTGAIQAFLWRRWPDHPKRVGVVIYTFTMMGGCGVTDESSGQIGGALGMSSSVVPEPSRGCLPRRSPQVLR